MTKHYIQTSIREGEQRKWWQHPRAQECKWGWDESEVIVNLFNEIIAEKSPNIMRELNKQTQEAFRTPNRYVEGKSSPKHYSQDVWNTNQRNGSEQKNVCSPTEAETLKQHQIS